MNVGIFDGSPSCKIISIMVTAWNVFFRYLKKGGYLLTYIHTPAKKYHWQWHHVLFQIEWGYGIVHNGWRLKSLKYFFLITIFNFLKEDSLNLYNLFSYNPRAQLSWSPAKNQTLPTVIGPIYNGKFDDYITFFVQQPSSVTYFLGATHKIYRIPLVHPHQLEITCCRTNFFPLINSVTNG